MQKDKDTVNKSRVKVSRMMWSEMHTRPNKVTEIFRRNSVQSVNAATEIEVLNEHYVLPVSKYHGFEIIFVVDQF